MPSNNERINAEGQFILSNGQALTDPFNSKVMAALCDIKPERSGKANGYGYSWDESGMAELFADLYYERVRYCPEVRCWFTYSAGAWRRDVDAGLAGAYIIEFYRLMSLYCNEIDNLGRQEEYRKFVTKLGDLRFRERLLKDASKNEKLRISARAFDNHPHLINCLNGTYDLEKETFREADWRDFLTMQTNFEYTIQGVHCARWESFINEVMMGDKDKALYLQKALGYSILGKANEECMFILHGRTTRNGKSTLLSAITHILGDYASVSPVSIICHSAHDKNAESANPVMASLKGKRFVTMAESNQYGKLDEEAIKQLTGGEAITTRNLYEQPMSWVPQFTLWLSCNDLPAVTDMSVFASERIRVIEFNRHFAPEEQDKNLKYEFKEKTAMQGIFAWLIVGYLKYKREGLKIPSKMQEVIDNYKNSNDYVLQFLQERCEVTSKGVIRKKSLYDAYKVWCRSNGYSMFSAKRFNAEMQIHSDWFDSLGMKDGYPVYKGITLKGGFYAKPEE